MEKKSSQGIPASSFLVASSLPSALVSSCNEERIARWQKEKKEEGRARLVGDSCVPKLHSSLRCHVSFHTCEHTYLRNIRTPIHAYVQRRTQTRSRLLGGGASSSTPRKYSGQYIPPSSLALLFRPFSPPSVCVVLFFLFLRRHVRETALRTEPISLVVAWREWILRRFWMEKFGTRRKCPRGLSSDDFAKIPSSSRRECCQATREVTSIYHFFKKCAY